MAQSNLVKMPPVCDLIVTGSTKRQAAVVSPPKTRRKTVQIRRAAENGSVQIKREVESDSESEVSGIENDTPEKETKIKNKNKQTSKDDEKSDYEKMIQMNRQRSLAFLQSLQIDEVKESFSEGVRNLTRKSNRPRAKRPAPSTPPPRRKSRRLLKLDLSEDAILQRSIEESKRESVTEPEELPKVLKFEEALKGMESFSDFIADFSELDHKEIKRTKEFPFQSLKICASQVAKVVPARVTAIGIHPVCDKILISAGSKLGHIGFWNMSSSSDSYVFYPHSGGVTNLKFNPYDSNQIVSSSYDGRLRCGDMQKHVFEEVYSTEYRTSCTFFDVVSKTTFIVAQQDGNIAIVDNRRSKKAIIKTHPCHDYSVKSVCVHPLNKNYFISSEIKGPIKLWDLRKLQEQPVFDIRHHKKSVTSAFLSPLTGKSIVSTSLDDSICIFDSSNLTEDISLKTSISISNRSNVTEEIPLKTSIKHNNFTGRWLSTFKAIWVPNSDDTFVVGSMLYPRRIEVFKDNGNNVCNLMGEDLYSITSLLAFHPSLSILAGASSSGKVFVFTDGV